MSIKASEIPKVSSVKKSPSEKFLSVGKSTNGFNVSRGLCNHLDLKHDDVVGFLQSSESNKWYIFKADHSDINKSYCFKYKEYSGGFARINCRPIANALLKKKPLQGDKKTQRFYVSSIRNVLNINDTSYDNSYEILLMPVIP